MLTIDQWYVCPTARGAFRGGLPGSAPLFLLEKKNCVCVHACERACVHVHSLDLNVCCVCITAKMQFDDTTKLVLVSTQSYSTHPPLGLYAPLRFWGPPFKNSGSTPDCHGEA